MRKRSRGTWTRCCWPAWKTVPGTGTPSGRRCASAAAPGSTCPPAPSTRHCGGSRQPASSTAPGPRPAGGGAASTSSPRPGGGAWPATGPPGGTSPPRSPRCWSQRHDQPADHRICRRAPPRPSRPHGRRGRQRPARHLRAAPRRPGRRAARLLLATGPVTGACWAAALLTSRAWTWPVPGAARLAFGTVLLITALALLAAATSRHRYQRTRLALLAGPVLIALDATAVTVALTAAPAFTRALALAVAVSLTRVVVTARTLPRLAAR